MKFLSDIRLLLLGLWLGASVFFIGVAQSAFAVLERGDLAGQVVSRNLANLNYAGIVIAVILLATSVIAASRINSVLLWIERFLLLALAAACAVGQFVVGYWMSSLRAQMGRPIEEIAAEDPLRQQFNMLHNYSEWTMMAAMIAALLTFFIISNRRFDTAVVKDKSSDVYDFSKEFKV